MLERPDIEAIAVRVAELMREAEPAFPREGLVDADTVAALLGVERGWVYEHKTQLGAVRLGDGAQPRWRFDAAAVRAYVRRRRLREDGAASRVRPGPRRTTGPGGIELLPLPREGRR